MSIQVTKWVQNLRESPTINIKAVADELKAQGKDIYDFGVGEMNPEIPLPESFKQGIFEAFNTNKTGYIPPRGIERLRKAISSDLKTNFQIDAHPDTVLVFDGPKDAFFKVALGLLDPAPTACNGVICFAPTYESFTHVAPLLTGKPAIVLPTSDTDFVPDLDQISKYLEANANSIAMMILNSPSNPSGAVYKRDFIEKLSVIIKKYPHLAVVSDEVYRTVRYSNEPHVSMHQFLPEQTFIIGGISKEVSGTGTRLGFVVAPRSVVPQLINLQGNTSSCASHPIEYGYAVFLEKDHDLKERNHIRDRLAEKRSIMLHHFETAEGLKDCQWIPPNGAFYFFPNVTNYFGRKTPEGKVINTDEDLALYVLHSVGVVTIPGSKFEKPGFIRLAFASSPNERLDAGCKLLAKALSNLKKN